jgi:hypothetical protein
MDPESGMRTDGGAYPFLNGTVFKVNGTSEIVLYNFTGGANGGNPCSSVILDRAGNIC